MLFSSTGQRLRVVGKSGEPYRGIPINIASKRPPSWPTIDVDQRAGKTGERVTMAMSNARRVTDLPGHAPGRRYRMGEATAKVRILHLWKIATAWQGAIGVTLSVTPSGAGRPASAPPQLRPRWLWNNTVRVQQ